MTPRIIGINASPRTVSGPAQEQSSTRLLLEHALAAIANDADTQIIDLAQLRLSPSAGCYSTDENLCGPQCTHYDDEMQMVFEKILAADGVIFASPVYWLSPASSMSVLFERLTELDPITRDPAKRLLQGKVAGALATAHVDGASDVCYDLLRRANYLGFSIPPHAFAVHVNGQDTFTLQNKERLLQDFPAFRNAQIVARNVLQMCLLTKNANWEVFYEMVHPMSENERKHVFGGAAELERMEKEKYHEKNKQGTM